MTIDLDVDEWAVEEPDEPLGRLELIELQLAELGKALHAQQKAAKPPPLKYQTLPEFVTWLLSWYRRQVFTGYELVWCPQWWLHPEAIIRLESLWRSYELLRHEAGTGISSWLRDHVDIHMPRLMAPSGPLERCTPTAHADDPLPPMSDAAPPAGWWTPADSGL